MALVNGHVTWTATKLMPDTDDVGTAPDIVAATATVTFSRPSGMIQDTATPQTVFVNPMPFAVDADGVLRDGQGGVGVDLPAGPWRVVFNVPGFVQPPETLFEVVSGQTVNLTNVIPLSLSGAVQLLVKGDKGDTGPQGVPGTPGAAGTATTSASALTSGTLAAARIADGSLPIAKLDTDIATQAELDAIGTASQTGNTVARRDVNGDSAFRLVVFTGTPSSATHGATKGYVDTRTPSDPAAATAGLRTLGTGATQAAAGDHLHDTRYVRTVNGSSPDGAGNVAVTAPTTDHFRVLRDTYGLKAVPYDPVLATATQAMTSGTMYLQRVTVIPGEVLTTFQTFTSSAGTGVTLYQAVLYLLDGTLVRSTANMTPAAGAMQASNWRDAGVDSAYTVAAGVTSMYIGLLAVGTTPPTVVRAQSAATAPILQFTMASGQRSATRTGLASIPSPMGTIAASNVSTLLAST